MPDTRGIDIVILCGGEGRRLRPIISNRPKAMALVSGRPFMDILIAYLAKFGFRRFILCVGYMADFIKKYYLDYKDLEIIFSQENKPLGTGGAIKNAKSLIKSSPFLVLNGDSFADVDLNQFLCFHINKNAAISIMIKKVKESIDYGVVELNGSKRIIGFNEKNKQKDSCYINMGIYLFEKEVLSLMPKIKAFSLEEDFFPLIIRKIKGYGYLTTKRLIDIGTPPRYRHANAFFKNYAWK